MTHQPRPTNLPAVTEALEEALRRGEVGIAVAAYLDGELIVDQWAGMADPARGVPVGPDTLFNVFSVTKAVTASALHVLASRGLFEYDDVVAAHWPEFGANGKETITIRDVLSHRAGIPWMPDGVTPDLQADWTWMTEQVAAGAPAYAPGTTNCYHALVWGWIVAELVRRLDPLGRDFDVFVKQELFEPLGISDLHLGLRGEALRRRAVLSGGIPPATAPAEFFLGMPRAVYPGSVAYNTEVVLGTVNAGAGMVGTPREVARFFAMLAGRGALGETRVLPAELVTSFLTPREGMAETDVYLNAPAPVGAYGYWRGGIGSHVLVGDRDQLLYHPGAGGSIAWAELDTGLAVAFGHNAMHAGPFPYDEHPYAPAAEAIRAHAAHLKRGHA